MTRARWLCWVALLGAVSCGDVRGPLLWEEPSSPTGSDAVVPAPPPVDSTRAPAVAGELCPSWLHDDIVAVAPDGARYPTWHPAVDPESGCFFGHEHGEDPRTSAADSSLPPFGYVARLAGVAEDHSGYKVFVVNAGQPSASGGQAAVADQRLVFHMGTTAADRFVTRYHSMEYDFIARDGSGREFHVAGMADTGTAIGSVCDTTRAGRNFATVGCGTVYETWRFDFNVVHPDDPATGAMEVRAHVGGSVAAFDPVTTLDPAQPTAPIYTLQARSSGPTTEAEALSPLSPYRGCRRELWTGPHFSQNAGRPTSYFTDVWGRVQPAAGPDTLEQSVAARSSTSDLFLNFASSGCGPGVRAPN